MITVDAREQVKMFKERADATAPLWANGEDSWTYDFLIERKDGKTIRVERKDFKDYMGSWLDQKLTRQLSYVNVLIVEMDPDVNYLTLYGENFERGMKHLAVLAMNMPVMYSTGVAQTWAIVKHLEEREDFEVRDNKIRYEKADPLEVLLDTLPRVNCARPVKNSSGFKVRLGPILTERVDRALLVEALAVRSWTNIPGIGDTTVQLVLDAIGPKPDGSKRCVKCNKAALETGPCPAKKCGGTIIEMNDQMSLDDLG